MSHKPFDHIADAHRRIKDAHQAARGSKSSSGGSAVLREQLIDAAERLLAERQVSAITTRDIARAAGLSDGVLYNYFADKNDLVVAALVRRFDAQLMEFETGLPEPGKGDVEENLVAYAEAWFDLARAIMPIVAGLMSEPALAHRFFAEIHDEEYGMRRTFRRIGMYIRAEQGLGRLGDFEVHTAVFALAGSMMALVMAGMVGGRTEAESRDEIRGIVRTLLGGIGTGKAGHESR
jgi:AcrR family transcriptional regulator